MSKFIALAGVREKNDFVSPHLKKRQLRPCPYSLYCNGLRSWKESEKKYLAVMLESIQRRSSNKLTLN